MAPFTPYDPAGHLNIVQKKTCLPKIYVGGQLAIVIVVHLGSEGDLVDTRHRGGKHSCRGVETAHACGVDGDREAGVGNGDLQGCPAVVVLSAVSNLSL